MPVDEDLDEDAKPLLHRFPRTGRLEWIGLRPHSRAAVQTVDVAEVIRDCGLTGDHRVIRPGSKRQVTLIQAEHLVAVARLLGRDTVDPALSRRNLVVSGINLLALADMEFIIGAVVLRGTGRCAPCSRMEEALGSGGFNAMRGHGGITALVIRGGIIRIGDPVTA